MSSQLIALSLVLISSIALSIYGILSKTIFNKRKTVEIKTTSGFDILSNEVGRVAEEGTAIHIALGNGGLVSDNAVTSIAALQGLSTLIDLAAAYDTPPYITTGDPTLYLLADNRLRKAYTRLGNLTLYQPNHVQFATTTAAGYAAVAAQQLSVNKIGSNIMLGTYNQEISLVADAADKQRIKSYGGSTSPQGLAVLYPALSADALIMGEQLFEGARDAQRSAIDASLWAQDILRWLVIAGIAGTAIITLVTSLTGGG
jgi:hypothetical protein